MIEWTWSSGEKYEKSPRFSQQNKPHGQCQEQKQENNDYNEEQQKMSQLAYQQSLLSESDVWSLEHQQIFVPQQFTDEKPLNKREDSYNKMAEREMVGQIGMNPFMNNNYLEDVLTQENFLKPISTNIDREKGVFNDA